MRLVNADALLGEMEKYSDTTAREKNEYLFGLQQRLETCIELVEDAPTVDAVPVVRCKDCEYWTGRKYNVHINGFLPWCRFSALQREANDYCSYGRRKDGKHETD